jgi:hypothetical protein
MSAEPIEQGRLERLHDEPIVAATPTRGIEFCGEELVERQPDRIEVGTMLELGDHPQHPIVAICGFVDQAEEVAQAQHRIPTVETRARLPQRAEALSGSQGRELRPREILGEPAREQLAVDLARRSPAREFGASGDIRRA